MLGAIVGDVIGSVYEWNNHRSKVFDIYRPDRFFTDDTVLTVATADAIMSGGDLATKIEARRFVGQCGLVLRRAVVAGQDGQP